jgi:DNA polymerase III psi subunit
LSSKVGRYDDIYAGYILQKIAQHFDLAVSFGEPIVRQERNVHVLLKDLDLEREGMECIDFFVDLLKSFDLSGSTVIELMFNFLEHLEATLLSISRNHFAFKTIAELHTGYSLWINALVEPTDWRR